MPLGILGEIAHFVMVKRQVEAIFKFRQQAYWQFVRRESNGRCGARDYCSLGCRRAVFQEVAEPVAPAGVA